MLGECRLDDVEGALGLPAKGQQPTQSGPRREILVGRMRIRLGVPPGGLGQRYSEITDWLDANCGADGWAITPSGVRGVLNDVISIYFAEATLASAFVARWCAGSKAETTGGVFQVRADEPAPRSGARLHRTP